MKRTALSTLFISRNAHQHTQNQQKINQLHLKLHVHKKPKQYCVKLLPTRCVRNKPWYSGWTRHKLLRQGQGERYMCNEKHTSLSLSLSLSLSYMFERYIISYLKLHLLEMV